MLHPEGGGGGVRRPEVEECAGSGGGVEQADAQPGRTAPTSVGVASWFVDSHDVQRYASGPPPAGVVVTEGCLNREANETAPPVCDTSGKWWPKPFFAYEVPYSVMLPPRADTANVLVPVAVSASHVAFQTLRLEPTWAVLGQAAGAAAALALAAAPRGAPVDDGFGAPPAPFPTDEEMPF